MSVPSSWELRNLGDISTLRAGSGAPQGERFFSDDGEPLFCGGGGVAEGYLSDKVWVKRVFFQCTRVGNGGFR